MGGSIFPCVGVDMGAACSVFFFMLGMDYVLAKLARCRGTASAQAFMDDTTIALLGASRAQGAMDALDEFHRVSGLVCVPHSCIRCWALVPLCHGATGIIPLSARSYTELGQKLVSHRAIKAHIGGAWRGPGPRGRH